MATVKKFFVLFVPCLLLVFCQGCATYEFTVAQPPSVGLQQVHENQQTRIHAEPFDLGFQAADGRLVMWVYNTGSEPIEILGSKSVVVDPQGQSHPLPNQTVAAGSFVKLILPPYRPQIEQRSPVFGIGIGGSFSRNDEPGYIRPAGYGAPVPMDIDVSSSPFYWDWEGQSEVRLTLAYQLGNKSDKIALVMHRVKK